MRLWGIPPQTVPTEVNVQLCSEPNNIRLTMKKHKNEPGLNSSKGNWQEQSNLPATKGDNLQLKLLELRLL